MRAEDASVRTAGEEKIDANDPLADRPPLFRTWGGVYAAVLGFHALLIFLFYLLTRRFS